MQLRWGAGYNECRRSSARIFRQMLPLILRGGLRHGSSSHNANAIECDKSALTQTVLSNDDADTTSIIPSRSMSAPTAQRAPMA
eukprot:3835759-Pleurochrysis_carterae.AAC.6